jgi:4'-phosphopantetheinyl transferase
MEHDANVAADHANQPKEDPNASFGEEVATHSLGWDALPSRPLLPGATVHLVAARIGEDFECGAGHFELLSDAEARRARRFRFDRHRNRWVAGRTLLKQLLGRYVDCDARKVLLGFGDIGKPFLEAPPNQDLQFNYTDSNGYLLYAFATGFEVGVDVEHLPRTTNYQALAPRKLSGIEQEALARVPIAQREVAFLANWTRKEAYGKALGVGIRYPMREVTLCEDFLCSDYSVRSGAAQVHHLVQIRPPFPGIACIAGARSGFAIAGFTLGSIP